MNKHPYGIIVLASLFFLLPSLADGKAKKSDVVKSIDKQAKTYEKMAKQIWTWAEAGYQEYKSSELLQKPWKKKVFLLKQVLQKYPRLLLLTMGLVNQSLGYWPNMMLCLDFLRK